MVCLRALGLYSNNLMHVKTSMIDKSNYDEQIELVVITLAILCSHQQNKNIIYCMPGISLFTG